MSDSAEPIIYSQNQQQLLHQQSLVRIQEKNTNSEMDPSSLVENIKNYIEPDE